MIFLDISFSRTMWWRLFIKYLHYTYIYVVSSVILIMDIVNYPAGLIMPYHMLDAEGCLRDDLIHQHEHN